MFGGEASDKKVKVLSGGERTRLAMIKLLLEPVNLLILDEPTNHLDMRSKDVLKEAIREFDGTVIIVSHDRDFLDGLATKVYEFGGGLVKEHLGGIYDFLQKKQIESLNELQNGATLSPKTPVIVSGAKRTHLGSRRTSSVSVPGTSGPAHTVGPSPGRAGTGGGGGAIPGPAPCGAGRSGRPSTVRRWMSSRSRQGGGDR